MLTLRLLGPMEASRDGSPVALPRSRKTRALLAYLALADQPMARRHLVDMLWERPDDPRGALRWSLSKLREIADDDETKRIVADRESVALDTAACEIDARQALNLANSDLESLSTEELEAAAALFRGGFLEGLDLSDSLDYHAWYIARVSEFELLHRAILEQLCERLAGSPKRALVHAVALTRLNPDDESLHARLDSLRAAAASPTAAARTARSSDDGKTATAEILRRPAVAVLPFENMSGDPEQEYFADGITEDIITGLCNWRWFPVIARNSSFAFKGQHVDVVSVGKQLGARYVLEGSVRRAGDRVRVTAQLIDAGTGHHLWAQRYDRQLDDVFAIQDELTAQIVAQIEPALARSERQRSEHISTTNLDAWDLNHRALAAMYSGRAKELDFAEELLNRSIELDPRSSHTYGLKALCLYHQCLLVWSKDPRGPLGTFKESARQAVLLDDENWLGHALLGMALLWKDRDYDGAAEETAKAPALNPSAALAHQFVGCIYNFDGHPADAITHLEAAVQLNPHPNAATLLLSDLALAHVLLERFEEALPYAKRAIGHFAGDIRAWQRLISALGNLGRTGEAGEALASLQLYQRRLTTDYIDATYPFRFARDRELFEGGLRKAGWDG